MWNYGAGLRKLLLVASVFLNLAAAEDCMAQGNLVSPPGSSPVPTLGDSAGNMGVFLNTTSNPGGLTWTTVTCGTSSTAFGVTGTSVLIVQIPAGGVNVGFGWGTNAATLAPPSEVFTAGTTIGWDGGTGSCIVSTGTQAITVGYK